MSKQIDTIETQLFDWKEWDDIDFGVMSFSECTLKVQIGNHSPTEFFDSICINYQTSILELYKNRDSTPESYSLLLSVGDKVE